MFRSPHLTHALACAFAHVANHLSHIGRIERLLLAATLVGGFGCDTAAAQSLDGGDRFRLKRALPLVGWSKPPPIVQMQGDWRNTDRSPGVLSRIIVHGTRLIAFVSRGGGDSLLAEIDARAYVGMDAPLSMLEVTRLSGAFASDSAEIELTLVLNRAGRLDVDQVVRYLGMTDKWDRWYRYEFRGGQSMAMMKKMATSDIPDFPWPPPRSSTRGMVPDGLVTRASTTETCGEIFDRLSLALGNAGYLGPSVYGIPNDAGFAVVTRLENIREDGFPLADRFTLSPRPDRPRTVAEFIATLFKAPAGFYRVIVFAVTSSVVTESDHEPSKDEANRWLNRGAQFLPVARRSTLLPDAHCEALIYEFRKPADGQATQFTDNLGAMQHLACGGLWRGRLP